MPVNMSRDDFEELLALAETGNETALKSLREIMAADRETWFPFGDLKAHARRQLLDSITRGNTIARESLHINLDEMRNEFRGDHENCVRDHAIDHVVTCWVDIHRQTMVTAEISPSRSAADFNDRRLANSHLRYQRALKFLNELNVQLGIQPVSTDLPVTQCAAAEAVTDSSKDDVAATEHADDPTSGIQQHIRKLVTELFDELYAEDPSNPQGGKDEQE